jgi:hypothetical protein
MLRKRNPLTFVILLIFIIGKVSALDTQSYDYIDKLLSLSTAAAPEFYEDAVIFTVPASYGKTGIAFAHENFKIIHQFKKLLFPIEDAPPAKPKSKTPPERVQESGLLFFTYEIPDGKSVLEYRLVVNGLWTIDPYNSNSRLDLITGKSTSILEVPTLHRIVRHNGTVVGNAKFHFRADSGEHITVAGDFNNWDPFMYELEERLPGQYGLELPLPAGTYRYVFFLRGERRLDPYNEKKAYYSDGREASELVVKRETGD